MSCLANQREQLTRLERSLEDRYREQLVVNPALDRRLVSFQANKSAGTHRWCPYREGFSAELVHYLLDELRLAGTLLDPFAGSGTTLFVGAERGLDTVGIELLPSSAEIIELRCDLRNADRTTLVRELRDFAAVRCWEANGRQQPLEVLPITRGAYPAANERQLRRYLHEAGCVGDPVLSRVLRFAALCVLESISYTRKDGQYLRWDYRSGRKPGARRFDKGPILDFTAAVTAKLGQIAEDLVAKERVAKERVAEDLVTKDLVAKDLVAKERGAKELADGFPRFEPTGKRAGGDVTLMRGSCLDMLPTLQSQSFDGLITSPPYCNRYDYTRTYALELALLGVGEQALKQLRQAMLSCTVENRFKQGIEDNFESRRFQRARRAFERQELLQAILAYLEACRTAGELNNTGIPRMVSNYFRELSLVVAEAARILQPGAPLVMVNDNVRYQGAHVPVDLILSDMASSLGFHVQRIWVLPKGKGNSSQQMSRHGRMELRKGVYIWRRTGTATRGR